MPRGDRTGPAGVGSMTGRAMGFCAGNSEPGYLNGGYGRGFGFGRGGGGRGWGRGVGFSRGWGRGLGYGRGFGWAADGWNVPYHPVVADEAEFLKSEAEFLKAQLKNVEGRIDALNKDDSKKSK